MCEKRELFNEIFKFNSLSAWGVLEDLNLHPRESSSDLLKIEGFLNR